MRQSVHYVRRVVAGLGQARAAREAASPQSRSDRSRKSNCGSLPASRKHRRRTHALDRGGLKTPATFALGIQAMRARDDAVSKDEIATEIRLISRLASQPFQLRMPSHRPPNLQGPSLSRPSRMAITRRSKSMHSAHAAPSGGESRLN